MGITKNELAKRINKPEKELGRRADGRIEWFCKHGVGHTVFFPKGNTSIHGCDGCCEGIPCIESKMEQ